MGVITNSQIQFIKGTDVQKTVPIQWDHKKVVATYNPVDKHVYISEQPTNSKNGSIYRIKFIGNQERPYAELIVAGNFNFNNKPNIFRTRLYKRLQTIHTMQTANNLK